MTCAALAAACSAQPRNQGPHQQERRVQVDSQHVGPGVVVHLPQHAVAHDARAVHHLHHPVHVLVGDRCLLGQVGLDVPVGLVAGHLAGQRQADRLVVGESAAEASTGDASAAPWQTDAVVLLEIGF